MPDRVVEPLGVNNDLRSGWKRHPDFGCRVIAIFAQNHDRVGILRQVVEGANDPACSFGVKPVIIVSVQIVDRISVGIRLQLNHPATTHICTHFLRPRRQNRSNVDILRHPHTIFVGLGRGVIPKSVTLHIAIRAGQRSKSSITG